MSTSGMGPGPLVTEARVLLARGVPNAATQLLMTSMGLVDMLMLGRLGPEAVAAAGLGHVWVLGTQLVALGLVLGVDPLMSQALGRHDRARAALVLQRGIVVALSASLAVGCLWLFTGPILVALGQDRATAGSAHGFVVAQMAGVPGFLVFAVLRAHLQARGIALPTFWVMLAANGINAFGNWVLIYGNLGCPALGVVGSGIATACSRVAMALLLLAAARWADPQREHWVPWSRASFSGAGLLRIAAVGLPVGVQLGLEVWAFAIAALFAGRLGTTALAANAIVLNLASLTFTMPLGVSFAASARIGNLIGAGDLRGAQVSARAALCVAASSMAAAGVVLALLRARIPALYAPAQPEVIRLCASAIPVVAALQIFDGMQVVGGAAMRGFGRTRPTAVIHLVAFYAVGIPAAWALAFRAGAGLPGIWTGLALGLFGAAAAITWWIEKRGPNTDSGRRFLRAAEERARASEPLGD